MNGGKPRYNQQGHDGGVPYDQYAEKLENISTVSAEQLVDWADKIGKDLRENLKMNQLRRFLDGVRKIEASSRKGQISSDQIVYLRPKLAYAAGRQTGKQKEALKNFQKVLDPALKATARDPNNLFQKLLRFVESIVAYHTYYGGK